MTAWKEKGCAVCRQQWMAGQRPEQLTINIELHTRLYRCSVCGSYWEENERYADVITEATVLSDYPGLIERREK
jgi:hypothetical protein